MKNDKTKKKMPKWVIILIVVLCLFVALPMFLITGFFVYMIIDSEINGFDYEKDLVIRNSIYSRYDENYDAYVITGVMENNGEEEYYDVEVYYTLYDKDNNIIGEATDYVYELEEGKTWKFSAEYFGVDAKDVYRIEFTDILINEYKDEF